jgi:hypothetical protein
MANDYKQLNRNQTWTVAQKGAIKKVFAAAQVAALANNHTGFGAKECSQILDPYLDANEADDIKRLCQGMREAITTATAATLNINPAGDDNALDYTAKSLGTSGNSITVTYTDPSGNDQALAVSVVDTDIDVSLATGPAGAITSTAAEVLAAVDAKAEATALVSVAIDTTDTGVADDGSGVVTAMTQASLSGGAQDDFNPVVHITAFRMAQAKKKVIKNLANSTIAQLTA